MRMVMTLYPQRTDHGQRKGPSQNILQLRPQTDREPAQVRPILRSLRPRHHTPGALHQS